MTIPAISALAAAPSIALAEPAAAAGVLPDSALASGQASGRADFLDALGAGLTRADHSLQAADAQLRALSAGQDVPIHEVMISMERARLDLMLVVEVRNRLIESYQEMMRMQL